MALRVLETHLKSHRVKVPKLRFECSLAWESALSSRHQKRLTVIHTAQWVWTFSACLVTAVTWEKCLCPLRCRAKPLNAPQARSCKRFLQRKCARVWNRGGQAVPGWKHISCTGEQVGEWPPGRCEWGASGVAPTSPWRRFGEKELEGVAALSRGEQVLEYQHLPGVLPFPVPASCSCSLATRQAKQLGKIGLPLELTLPIETPPSAMSPQRSHFTSHSQITLKKVSYYLFCFYHRVVATIK